jgi:predicted nucleic acid-binding protein
MKLVLDASMALSWIFERIDKKELACSEKVLAALQDTEIYVPSLWHTEVTNALLIGERRKVVTEAQVIDYLNKLSHLPIMTDETSVANRREIVMTLARKHSLTTYDATYLDLALRNNATLATFDMPLANAMRSAGGAVFGDN